MTALAKSEPISIEDYLSGEEVSDVKHEFLGGVVHAMAGATNRHSIISGNAFGLLFGQLRGKACQPFNSDTKIRIQLPDQTRFYYPDAMVVCVPNPATDRFQDRPVVVIEVLSESTRRTDLGEKAAPILAADSSIGVYGTAVRLVVACLEDKIDPCGIGNGAHARTDGVKEIGRLDHARTEDEEGSFAT